jgi:hypothetical protein
MHPLAVYTADGKSNERVQLIRESNINAALQSAAKTVYNITKQEELSRFTPHSIRVGACFALHAAGIDPLNIKHALCWKSDSFLTGSKLLYRPGPRAKNLSRPSISIDWITI